MAPSIADVVAQDALYHKTRTLLDLLTLKNKVTVLTGAGRGIGLSLARVAAELGSDVALLDVLPNPPEDIKELEERFWIRAKYYQADVTNLPQLTEVVDKIKTEFGQINNCVSAAGICIDKPFLDHTWDDSVRTVNVNILGSFFIAQLTAKAMKEQKSGGSIVLVSSSASHIYTTSRCMSIYSASKGAISALTTNLAVELAEHDIRVNAIAPGFIATEMVVDQASTDPQLWIDFNEAIPLKRMGRREDLKGVVALLLSPASSFITGGEYAVDGGMTCGRK